MKQTSRSTTLRLVVCLFSLLLGFYWLTYRGVPISGDEIALFSSTESLVRYQESRLYSAYYQYQGVGDSLWSEPVHEPMQTLLAIPLYWIAFQSDSLGMVHTVWIFNIWVTASIGVLFYLTARTLGYRHEIGFVGAMLLGVSTMLWPYTQTYFREPLAAFWVLLAFYLAFMLQKQFRVWVGMLLLLVCAAALLTKESLFLIFPSLLVVLSPANLTKRRLFTWVGLLIVGIIFIGGVIFLISSTNFGNERFSSQSYQSRVQDSTFGYFWTVVRAYLFSPGRSIWATSPILLLSFYGAWLAYRNKNWRLAVAPLMLLLTVTFGYGVGGWDWHGGLGWGTRYLLHVVPILALLLLPVLEKIRALHRGWWVLGGAILLFSVVIQVSGVLVRTDFAFNYLLAEFPEKGAQAFEEEGVWQLRYTQWYLHLTHIDWENLPLAWQPVSAGIWVGIGFIALGILGMFFPKKGLNPLLALPLFILIWLVGIGFSLRALHHDPRIKADRPELQALLEAVEQQTGQDDLVILANPEYLYFFLNEYRGDAVMTTMPYLASERYSPADPVPVVSDTDGDGVVTPNEYLDAATGTLIPFLNQRYDNLWLVMNSGPFSAWAKRPLEQVLTANYFPVAATTWAEDVRLIQIYPFYNWSEARSITRRLPFIFGENLHLSGYDRPLQIEAGAILPVVLLWEKTGDIAFNYNISVQLVDEIGVIHAQHDSPPQATFGDMTQWERYTGYMDIHGLALPANLPLGRYSLRVVAYDWRDAARLPVTQESYAQDYAEIGVVEIVASGTPLPITTTDEVAPPLETPYQFGENFLLTGIRFPEQAVLGETITVVTEWDIPELQGSYNVSVQLVSGIDVQSVTAVNGLPISLFNETFQAGSHRYTHTLYIPLDFPEGSYQLQLSITDWRSLTTLTVSPTDSRQNPYYLSIATIQVEQAE